MDTIVRLFPPTPSCSSPYTRASISPSKALVASSRNKRKGKEGGWVVEW